MFSYSLLLLSLLPSQITVLLLIDNSDNISNIINSDISAQNAINKMLRRNMDRTHAETCKTNSEEKLITSLPMEFHVFLKHLKKLNYNHKPGTLNNCNVKY